MKKTKLSLILSGLMIVTAVIVVSCKKSTTPTVTPDTSTTSATDNNLAQQSAHDVTNMGSQAIDNGSLSTYRLAGGGLVSPQTASVTIVHTPGTKTLTITFTNYHGLDGNLRNGTIEYDWSASVSTSSYTATYFKDSGLVLSVTTPFNDYSVNGNSIKINKKTIRNLGRKYSGTQVQLTWSDTSNITITKPGATTPIQWQGDWSIALLNTGSYTSVADDGTSGSQTYSGVFSGYGNSYPFINWAQALVAVSGSFSGTASDGETYSGNISTPLVLNFNCTPDAGYTRFVYVAGVLNFTPTGKTTRSINYGSGACDLTFNLTIGAFSVNLTL